MTRPGPSDFKAMRIIGATEAWPVLRAWLLECLAANRAATSGVFDAAALNRLVGERETILTILDEFRDAPANEARAASHGPPPDGLAPGFG